MACERVVVTGLGAVTPLGNDLSQSWEGIVSARSGAAAITLFDSASHRVRIACEVKDWAADRWIERSKLKEMDRFSEFAVGAAAMAAADAGLELSEREQERAGCFLGVGLGGLATIEQMSQIERDRGPGKISPYTIPRVAGNLAAGQVSIHLGLRGPSFSATSACASGAHAIGEAFEWIRRGRADVMLAGGSEACISPVVMGAFSAMRALSRRNDAPEQASRPFDSDRDGFVCGEGAGALVLESLTRARRRGARIHAELLGYGASSDAHHISSPTPGGEGIARCMKLALEDARLDPAEIDYINAHATSTPAGDQAECDAIVDVFGAHATDHRLAVSSTKSMTGHLLGAAAAIEAVFTVLALREGVLPPTINLDRQDPAITLDCVQNTARERSIHRALSNGFGFGGTNASLAFARWND